MKTCVSINCLFIGFCKDYNNEIDRSNGCKMQEWIISRADEHRKREHKAKRNAGGRTKHE